MICSASGSGRNGRFRPRERGTGRAVLQAQTLWNALSGHAGADVLRFGRHRAVRVLVGINSADGCDLVLGEEVDAVLALRLVGPEFAQL